MEAGAGADVVDDVGGIGIDGGVRDVLIPGAGGGEGHETAEACADTGLHLAAAGGLLRAADLEIQRVRRAAAGIGIDDA